MVGGRGGGVEETERTCSQERGMQPVCCISPDSCSFDEVFDEVRVSSAGDAESNQCRASDSKHLRCGLGACGCTGVNSCGGIGVALRLIYAQAATMLACSRPMYILDPVPILVSDSVQTSLRFTVTIAALQ